MATVITKISDIGDMKEVFGKYMIEETTKYAKLISSGIATPDPKIAALINEGGKTINLPSWDGDLTSDEDEVLLDGGAMPVSKITAFNDVAVKHLRGRGFGATDLSAFFAGDDPMGAILECVGKYWARNMQRCLLSTLDGVFANTELAATNVHDNGTGVISYETLTAAMYLLGDHYESLTTIAMHSAVMNKLAQLRLLETYPNPVDRTPFYTSLLGKQVIVDDSLVADENGKYPIYLFGAGSVAYNEATGIINAETDRDKQAGVDYLFTRRAFTMHPRGVKWIGTPAGETPTNAELAVGTNWELVGKPKNIRIALLKTKIA